MSRGHFRRLSRFTTHVPRRLLSLLLLLFLLNHIACLFENVLTNHNSTVSAAVVRAHALVRRNITSIGH